MLVWSVQLSKCLHCTEGLPGFRKNKNIEFLYRNSCIFSEISCSTDQDVSNKTCSVETSGQLFPHLRPVEKNLLVKQEAVRLQISVNLN